jgi:DNA-binding transcriptional LysR family regulator
LGGLFFERTSRRVALTPLGARLRERLAPAHRQMTEAVAAARADARSTSGEVRVGFAATTAGPDLDRLVVAFERAHPGCTVSLREAELSDSYGPLQSGEVDVLCCWLVFDDPALVLGPAIARYSRVLAVAADHPLARERDVSVEVLADHPVPTWDFRGLADRVRRAMVPSRTPSGRPVREHPTVVRTVGEVGSLVARGQVVLPTVSMQHFGGDGIALVPIRDLPPVPLGIIWPASRENARIRALAEVARTLAP